MTTQFCSMLPKFTDLMADQLFYKKLVNSECLSSDENKDYDENLYDFNELGERTSVTDDDSLFPLVIDEQTNEVFSDHIIMGKRLQKTLYRGNIQDLDEDTDHPPIALTDIALKLFSKTVPNYGLDQLDMDYVSSVSEATRVSPCAMILALIYLERLQIKNSDYLESVSPSGLFVVTMLVASKFLFEDEDDIVTNQIWSEALNIDVKELNQLEQKFLSAIDWRVYVDSSEYYQYLSSIEKMIAVKQSSFRGWLSYSDICSILQDTDIRNNLVSFIERIFMISAFSALSYTVTLLSLYAAGLALRSTYSANNSTLKDDLRVQNDVELQSSFTDITSVGLHPGSTLFVDESSDPKVVVSTTSSYEFSDFSYVLQNPENFSHNVKRHDAITYYGVPSIASQKVESKFNFYIDINSFHNVLNRTLYGLHLSPFSFKNTCIPVSVK